LDRGFLFSALINRHFFTWHNACDAFSRRGLGFMETGEPPGSNLEKTSWVSSAL
jgi:hypothetical protein